MEIVEGRLPEDRAWRALVLLAPGANLGVSWQLGLSLSRANKGEIVFAIILPEGDQNAVPSSQETLHQARIACEPKDSVYTVVVQAKQYHKAAAKLAKEADIDLLVTSAETPGWKSLGRMPCAVAIVRGQSLSPVSEGEQTSGPPVRSGSIQNILVPTSGGPNSAHALSFLVPLTEEGVGVTALYVAAEYRGQNELALGKSRLRQTLNFIDAQQAIEQKLISSESAMVGIVNEALGIYDLVIIGATRESSLDKTLFGNLPEAVVNQSRIPVVVVREPSGAVPTILSQARWATQSIRLNIVQRTEAYVRIRRGARPSIDFYVLIGLAAAIAALGLLANSAAVVIGAMLVAPLMSPIAGSGLAIVLGDTRFLRLTFGAILWGALLALLMGFLVGLIPLRDPLTPEVLARTQPTLLDVGVAILSGMAVAYALCRSSATAALPGVAIAAALVPPLAVAGISLANGFFAEFGGALLLFLTNFVAISSASALVFILLGFRPTQSKKKRQAIRDRTIQIAVVFLVLISALVAFTTYRLTQETTEEERIEAVAEAGVNQVVGATMAEITIGDLESSTLNLNLEVRSPVEIPHERVVSLQEYIGTELQREVAITLMVIRTTELDPFAPPPPTATPLATITPLPCIRSHHANRT
jgi:uncharacterized hydrophobic protein (TIGR00271 family)